MQTNPVGLNALATGGGAAVKNTEVSSDMFLNLLVTQLKNQDPLSPTDNTAFVAQLAQFSSLEGINKLNTNFTNVSDSMNVLNNYGASGLIGKNVTVKGSSFSLQGSPVPLGYDLNNPADTVTLTVFNSEGKVVDSAKTSNVPAGTHEFIWDGLDSGGSPLPAGEYGFSVTAGDGSGNNLPLDTNISGTVQGVNFFGDTAKVVIGGAMFPAADIKEVF